jgi:hypothetical protein
MNDFSVVCNSINSTNYLANGNNNSALQYQFDFTPFKNGQYELTFSFVGGNGNYSPSLNAFLSINWGGSRVYTTSTSSTAAVGTGFIGILSPTFISAASGYLKASLQDNPPVNIQLPPSSSFTVSVLKYDGTTFTDNSAANLANYMLVLHFRKINE